MMLEREVDVAGVEVVVVVVLVWPAGAASAAASMGERGMTRLLWPA